MRVTGSGSGSSKIEGGEQFSHGRLNVTNVASFFGYPVNRETLNVASARIYDPKTRKYEVHVMRWQGAPDNKPFNTEIKAGESTALFVYGTYQKRVNNYAGNTLHNIELSETLVELGSSRKLEIHISDNLQRRYKIRFKISAEERRNSQNGMQVSLRTKTTVADRWRNFRYGLMDMIRAFTTPSY